MSGRCTFASTIAWTARAAKARPTAWHECERACVSRPGASRIHLWQRLIWILKNRQMIADTVEDVEAGHHWAKAPTDPQSWWIAYIDRRWLQRTLHDREVELAGSASSSDSMQCDYAGVRKTLTFDFPARRVAAYVAVILADVASAYGRRAVPPLFHAGLLPAKCTMCTRIM